MPLGSSSENTKHEKASRNSGPHGPWAIPPRHGQSQLISPVTGLYAPPEAPLSSDEAPSELASPPSVFLGSTSLSDEAEDLESDAGGESGIKTGGSEGNDGDFGWCKLVVFAVISTYFRNGLHTKGSQTDLNVIPNYPMRYGFCQTPAAMTSKPWRLRKHPLRPL